MDRRDEVLLFWGERMARLSASRGPSEQPSMDATDVDDRHRDKEDATTRMRRQCLKQRHFFHHQLSLSSIMEGK